MSGVGIEVQDRKLEFILLTEFSVRIRIEDQKLELILLHVSTCFVATAGYALCTRSRAFFCTFSCTTIFIGE